MENITYEEFIQNILDTRGRFVCGEEYHEVHHIIPRCIGGTDSTENLIDLYAKEHYEAHRLLALENPENEKLIYAWWCMSTIKSEYTKERYEISDIEYEEVKKAYADMMSDKMSGERNPMYGVHRYGSDNPMYNVHRYGEDNPFYGKNHTEKTKEKMKKAAKNRTEETFEKISIKAKERFSNPKNNPMYGRHHTEKAREKMKKAKEGIYIGGNNPRAKKIIRLSDNKIYNCIIDAAEDNNMNRNTMRNRCKKHKDFMYYDEYLLQLNNPT